MTDEQSTWADDRLDLVNGLLEAILAERPAASREDVLLALGMAVTVVDESWRGLLRRTADQLVSIGDHNPALLPGLRVAAKTLTTFEHHQRGLKVGHG